MSQQFATRIDAMWAGGARIKAVGVSLSALSLVGCSSSPEFNLLGSYFPSWIICLASAIALTFAAHVVITKRKLADQLWPLPLVYTSLVCFLSCTFWIIFFE
jgi:hypothetical protein